MTLLLGAVRSDQLGGDRRGRGAHVRGELRERHVGVVADADHDRARVRRDGADDGLLVEGPEVLERAPAAGHDDHIDREPGGRVRPATDATERTDDGLGSSRALDLAGTHDDPRQRPAPGDDAADVVEHGTREGRHDADTARPGRQRALSARVEEALGREACLGGLETKRQVSHPRRLEAVHVELVGALRLEDVHPPMRDDPDAGAGLQRHDHAIVAEDHAAQLCPLVLQREIAVPGRADRDLADLALDPHTAEPWCGADGVADEACQVADR